MKYHKIQTVYLRDPETKYRTLLEGQFSLPEFEYLQHNDWAFTEKVDGTNIRIYFDGERITFGGRTDKSQLPAPLLDRLHSLFDHHMDKCKEMFPAGVCLYGEGYGAKIQKGGGNYRSDQSFVLFDVRVGNWWLKRNDVELLATSLNLDVVPVIGIGTLGDMVERTKAGVTSTWGDFSAEGIVARPCAELFARNGKRLITKVKGKDFS